MKNLETTNGTSSGLGRPRDPAAHQAILAAALSLLEEEDYRAITVEAIAARAGVGKQTIYRWWPANPKAEVVLEAFAGFAAAKIPLPDEGSLQADLQKFLEDTFATRTAEVNKILRSLMAEAQLDPAFSELFRQTLINSRRQYLIQLLERGVERGELNPQSDLNFLVDVIYGVMWYRLLIPRGSIDAALARQLTELVLR